jgi:toxin ParE1/3/4
LAYVASQSPQGAARIGQRLREILRSLEKSPQLGKNLDEPGKRRLPVNPYPYRIDYRIDAKEVVVLRFRHGTARGKTSERFPSPPFAMI